MPKFRVHAKENKFLTTEIIASNEQKALEIAESMDITHSKW